MNRIGLLEGGRGCRGPRIGLRQERELTPAKERKEEKVGTLFCFDMSELLLFSLKEKKEA